MAVVMNDQRLSEAHSECVKEALSEMERFVSCRIRKGVFRNSEKLEVTGNLIAGLYNHNASRALDPQIHTHCVVANVTWCESEQRYKALSEFENPQSNQVLREILSKRHGKACSGTWIRYRI